MKETCGDNASHLRWLSGDCSEKVCCVGCRWLKTEGEVQNQNHQNGDPASLASKDLYTNSRNSCYTTIQGLPQGQTKWGVERQWKNGVFFAAKDQGWKTVIWWTLQHLVSSLAYKGMQPIESSVVLWFHYSTTLVLKATAGRGEEDDDEDNEEDSKEGNTKLKWKGSRVLYAQRCTFAGK